MAATVCAKERDETFCDAFSGRLRELMEADGKSVERLARASGVSPWTIKSYLDGSRVPRLDTACRLSAAMGFTPNDLCVLPGLDPPERVRHLRLARRGA